MIRRCSISSADFTSTSTSMVVVKWRRRKETSDEMAEEQAARSFGKVLFFNDKRGFGFIKPDDGGEDLFVHHTAIQSDGGYRTLSEDDAVEFTVVFSEENKHQAVDVTAPGGGSIRPSNNRRGPGFRDGYGKRGGGFGGLRSRRSNGGSNNGNGGGAGVDGCYNCGNPGHIARDCDDGRAGGGESYAACYNCGTVGHFARDCTGGNNGSGNGGGGGRGRGCFSCGEHGHVARDCLSGAVTGSCYNCGGVGHLARDCPSPVTRGTNRINGGGGGRSSSCFHCGKEGHFARECPANA